jgi:hypothetical protein
MVSTLESGRGLLVVAALTLLSCASAPPRSATANADAVHLMVEPVPLDPQDPTRTRIGSFVYAGGLEISSAGFPPVLELSDLRVVDRDRLVAVSDRGYLFEARLLFDAAQGLSGLADARVIPLVGDQGELLTDERADAEGLDLLANGDRLVAFERDHRIRIYRPDGRAPRPATQPDATFPANEGMEAITRYPSAGPDAYLVGSEGGVIWRCAVSAPCRETPFGRLVPSGLGLTALSAYGDDGSFALLGRAYDPERGVRIALRMIETTGAPEGRVVDEMTIARPLTVDNFEGVAVVTRPGGGVRLYLLSDDNGSAEQRTFLLAFDWPAPR